MKSIAVKSTLREIASLYGIEYATLHARLKSRNIPVERVGNVIVVSRLNVERLVRPSAREQKHREHPMYRRWIRIRPKACVRWQKSFEAFVSDVGSARHGMKLIAIDGDQVMSKSNHRWV